MPRILYKYFPPGRATVLRDGHVRFSQVAALNDPYESTAEVATDALIAELVGKMERELDDFVAGYGDESATPEAQASVSQAREKLRNHIRWRADPERMGRDVMGLANARLGVLSLSRTSKSVLMWAHYAQDHTGFVVGLDESDSFFTQPDGQGCPTKPHDVIYSRRRVPVDLTDANWYQTLLCQKALAWKYEKETRVFRVLSQANQRGVDAKGLPVHLFPLSKNAICKVIFGANSPPGLRAEIMRYIRGNSIKAEVYRARLSKTGFGLIFESVPLCSYRYEENAANLLYVFPQARPLFPVELEAIVHCRDASYFEYDIPMPSAACFVSISNDVLTNYKLG